MLPLDGKRILITRTRRQASALAEQLRAEGATPIAIPAIEIAPPTSYEPLDDALATLGGFDWLLFTSANAVTVFADRRDPESRPKQIAAIGPATARAVEAIGLHVDLMPPRYIAESLAEELAPRSAGKRMLLIRAEEARDVLPEALIAAGADLTIASAYRNVIPASSVEAVQEIFSTPHRYPDVVTLTSASTARSLVALLKAAGLVLPAGVALASIGPVTSAAIRDLGYEPAIEAEESTIISLTDAVMRYFM